MEDEAEASVEVVVLVSIRLLFTILTMNQKQVFLTCGHVWTTVGLTKEEAQFKYADTQKRN